MILKFFIQMLVGHCDAAEKLLKKSLEPNIPPRDADTLVRSALEHLETVRFSIDPVPPHKR